MNHSPQHAGPGTLRQLVEARLADSDLSPDAQKLLLDSFDEDTGPAAEPAAAYLQSVRVRGFRGIGEEAELRLAPRPGLTLVTGPNGSGKSTFAEGMEIALTGDNLRWKRRSGIWRESWRNLHHTDTPQVEVDLSLPEESTTATVHRTWNGEDLAGSRCTLRRADAEPEPLSALGWEHALDLYRPFLSYSELGQVVNGTPSEMYDAVAAILGLEALTTADKRLRERIKELEEMKKRVKAEQSELGKALAALEDSRAQRAARELAATRPDLERLREIVAGGRHAPGYEELAHLHRLGGLNGPDREAVAKAAERLRSAAAAEAKVRGTSAEAARRRADLMERALAHHRAHPDETACPVCGGAERIGPQWAEATAAEVENLRTEAAQAETARREFRSAVEDLQRLVQDPPAWLPEELSSAWRAWLACRELTEPAALAREAGRAADALAGACRKVREEAAAQLAALDQRWLDVAGRLAAWLARAEQAASDRAELAELKTAQTWLRSAHDELREERMRPLAEMSQFYWSKLRQQSSVELGGVRLAGANTKRKVILDVSVDEHHAPALGVMSQGELLSLALSLFLPRATSPESPFRFLVIDDPVQSMDPAKVDGLAQVLNFIGKTRQIVVFTHDTRLADSMRYQRLPATILEVTRGEGSQVGVKTDTDPVERFLNDACALLGEPKATQEVVALVLPGLCRNALEAAFKELAWRRLLQGHDHPAITEKITQAGKLQELAALALYGKRTKAKKVPAYLRKSHGTWAADLVDTCNKGAHEPVHIPDPQDFLRKTRELAGKVRAL